MFISNVLQRRIEKKFNATTNKNKKCKKYAKL